jgi:hypothetical protein
MWNITVSGGVAGGPLQVRAEGIGEALRRGISNANVSVPTTGPAAGLALVGKGIADVSVGTSTRMALGALAGEDPFDQPYDVKAIALWGADLFMLIANPDAGLATFRDLVDQKAKVGISVGPEGSGSFQVFSDVAAVHGITFDDIDEWGGKVHYVYQAPSLDLLADGLIDALGGLWTQPSARIVDLTQRRDMVWVGLDEKAVADLGVEFGYEPATVSPPPDFGFGYEFVNTGDVQTVRMGDVIVVSADMSVDEAYIITKTIFEAQDYLLNVHAAFKWLTPENAVSLGKVLDLHEGAKKYLREVGALK